MKNKNDSFFDSFLTKFKTSERFNAGTKLSLYFIFFLIIILASRMTSSGNNTQNEVTEPTDTPIVSYDEKKDITYNEILTSSISNADIEISITISDKKYHINETIKDNVIEGYLDSENGTIHFLVENDVIYEIKIDKQENKELFKSLNTKYIYVNKLIEYLKQYRSTIEIKEEGNTYTYNVDGIKYIIAIQNEKVTSINIRSEKENYIINFK